MEAKTSILAKPKSFPSSDASVFFQKLISAETRYEIYDEELLAIAEAFKNCKHYLEGCKHELLVRPMNMLPIDPLD